MADSLDSEQQSSISKLGTVLLLIYILILSPTCAMTTVQNICMQTPLLNNVSPAISHAISVSAVLKLAVLSAILLIIEN